MKISKVTSIVFAITFGCAGLASANCADDAINTCNTKHPNPSKSTHAYELYELCIKAQLGQQCPNATIDTSKLSTVFKSTSSNSRLIKERYQLDRRL